MIQPAIDEILKECGCLDFMETGGDLALAQIGKLCVEGWEYLSGDARRCLIDNYSERLGLIYSQALMAEIRSRLEKHDPVGILLGKLQKESVKKSVRDLMAETGGRIEKYLHEKYPLLEKYKRQIEVNFISCFSDFLMALISKKDEISERLLGGKPIGKILKLSTGGADIHRNGRCVIGVTTDAGIVYYKPHDCGLDVLYHEIVERWFSDCTIAADVVEGRLFGTDKAFAFVSCLKHEPVSCEEDIAKYYYNFGILAALFHGLGSNDMHQENIISCAEKPSGVDMETILGTAVKYNEQEEENQAQNVNQELSDSLMRTCILPMRVYKGPIISPLYSSGDGAVCLPKYDGKFKTVEGHEEEFARGFREGYGRMLAHRDEIVCLIDKYENATVRCLLRNTRFYYMIRQMLFKPEHLTAEAAREKVYAKLCSPYTMYDLEPDKETTRYEWQCILKGDIPYYCTTVAGKDLCGEDPGQVVTKAYYKTSVQESAQRFLGRLSWEEEAFEQELIRVIFEHAPVDEEKDVDESVPEENRELNHQTSCSKESGQENRRLDYQCSLKGEILKKEAYEIFRELKKDAIRCSDGSFLWMSTAQSMEVIQTCGNVSTNGEVGMFASLIAGLNYSSYPMNPNGNDEASHAAVKDSFSLLPEEPEVQNEALELAENAISEITRIVENWEHLELKEDKLYQVLPTGLYAGQGGVILALHKMALAGFKEAFGLAERFVRLILNHSLYSYKKTNVAEGAAGLVLALTVMERTEDVKKCIRASADRLLEEELPDRADLPYGCAGIGAALMAAYACLRDSCYLEGARKAFQKVLDDYKPGLSGWPDGNAQLKWMADKGPHSAGIYLATAFAKEKLGEDENTQKGVLNETSIAELDSILGEIYDAALQSLLGEKTLLRNDSLDQGNALTVLALLKAGERMRAGHLFAAMLKRKEKKGCFTVTPEGVRSSFDPSYYMGTTGIGYAMLNYIKA